MQSLRNKRNELEAFIVDKDFHIIGVTEHWLTGVEMESMHIQGYTLTNFSTRTRFSGGGTAIYVKDGSGFGVLNIDPHLVVEKCFEGCCIVLRDFNIAVIVVYRSPSGDFDTFLASMGAVLDQISPDKQIILAGDFNVNFLKIGDVSTAKLLDLLHSYNLDQTIFEPTRAENCLDNVFIEHGMSLVTAGVWDMGFSDHRAQIVELSVENINRGTTTNNLIFRPITQRGMYQFYNVLSESDWSFVDVSGTSVDEKFGRFMEVLVNACA